MEKSISLPPTVSRTRPALLSPSVAVRFYNGSGRSSRLTIEISGFDAFSEALKASGETRLSLTMEGFSLKEMLLETGDGSSWESTYHEVYDASVMLSSTGAIQRSQRNSTSPR